MSYTIIRTLQNSIYIGQYDAKNSIDIYMFKGDYIIV
jgi:hypothetical protein